jgi:hypothetical protein
MLAFGEIDVALEVGIPANVDEADGVSQGRSRGLCPRLGVDCRESGRRVRDDTAIAKFERVQKIGIEGV